MNDSKCKESSLQLRTISEIKKLFDKELKKNSNSTEDNSKKQKNFFKNKLLQKKSKMSSNQYQHKSVKKQGILGDFKKRLSKMIKGKGNVLKNLKKTLFYFEKKYSKKYLKKLGNSEEFIIYFCSFLLSTDLKYIRTCGDILDKLYHESFLEKEKKKPNPPKENIESTQNQGRIGLDIEAINKLFTFGGEQGMLLDYEKVVEDHIFELAANLVQKMKKKEKGKDTVNLQVLISPKKAILLRLAK
jgi:hypothetical protein